jgi:NAD(P)-dependent dehydrogenase (short-subunit alcohol dehydrogenase family)
MISHAASNQELEALKMLNPQKRLGRPEEIADLALFLCTDAATFINGSASTIWFINSKAVCTWNFS